MITILNYGMGNLGSIHNMFRKIGVESSIVTSAEDVERAEALVLPGVGHFDHAMSSLKALGLMHPLEGAARERRIPILGICLGMQLMTRGSEEGELPGLGWIDAETRMFGRDDPSLRVPHMGWNTVRVRRPGPLFDARADEQRFYFVHSYAIQCDDPGDVLTTTTYGIDFVSAFGRDNLLGVQFHPEKSHKFGMTLLRRFASLCGCGAPVPSEVSVAR
jgi:glutamine amidotransferase